MGIYTFLFRAVKIYFANGSLHGLRFIAEEGRHWSERLLWMSLCILSWIGSTLLIMASWDAFQNNAVSFVVETTYLHVNTSFPSVSVCEEDNMIRIYEAAQELFGDDHDCNLDEVLKEITYFKGTAYYIKEFCLTGDLDCPKANFSDLSDMVRSPCQETFIRCAWRGVEFDCCEHFKPTETEIGKCFTLSMENERSRKKKNLPYINLISNRKTPLGSLSLELNISCKIYLHSEADVPFYNTMTTDILIAQSNTAKQYRISIIDIENGADVRDLSVHQRKCRFPDENYLESSYKYSYSACVVECRRKEQLRICNCTSHLMPNSRREERCDINGILCLNNNYGNLSVQKTKWGKKDGLICDCLPGCNDPEYSIITVGSSFIAENQTNMEINLDRLPSERYKRNVVRGRLDLVVSMGGAAGLFVGASLLSFVEIFYFFIFRSRENSTANSNESDKFQPKVEVVTVTSSSKIMNRNSVNYPAKIINLYNPQIKKLNFPKIGKLHTSEFLP
ncbi:sodium channel protein Nach isoform X1 [Halyomorpha halys]|uniref:sodium channel protein Nach isoform X1 n=1 Tax=Halyomorpha halys TaxID=286706 RepID=UPI0006D4D672|nr:sodium channel protein Nach isoform X1 [Halyomorpha halys]